jgi:hypothetical protein
MLHLLRLAVGTRDIAELKDFQLSRANDRLPTGFGPVVYTITKRFPKRAAELAGGGSLYWVIKGQIRVRQPIHAVERVADEAGEEWARLVLGADWIETLPTTCRPFQGWRYFEPSAAPLDLAQVAGATGGEPPAAMLAELKSLGLI